MASIKFTDTSGTYLLHNNKPHPADRFRNWTPDWVPVGDSAVRLSDGAITMFRVRDDYGASFELPYIPALACSNICRHSEDFGTTWVATAGTPTRTPAAHTKSGITLDLIGDDSAVAIEGYEQTITFTGNGTKAVSGFFKPGTSQAASGSKILLSDSTASVNRIEATVTWSAGAPTVVMTTGTYIGAILYADGVYRLLFTSTSVTAANTNLVSIRPAGTTAEQGDIYAGGIQVENNTTPTGYAHTTTGTVGVSMLEVADRLRRHLLNGGTCSVFASDIPGSSYATCGLKPGTTPQLALTDARMMEHTMSLHLINLAGSPSQMMVRYTEAG